MSAGAIGWTSSGAMVATPSRSVQRVTIAAKSWNWVAGTIVQGTGPASHEALLLALAGVVGVAFDPVDADDRQQHVVAHAGPLLGGEQVAGGGAEVGHRLVGIGRRRVRGVDERLDTSERLVQPVAGEEVHAQRAADADDVVPVPLEGGGGECADVAGRSGDCDAHEKPPLMCPRR